MSVKVQILQALATRLESITTANAYTTGVKKVYYDKIPMGMELNDFQLPAIFILETVDNLETEHPVLKGAWEISLQLWHKGNLADSIMNQFVRDVFKAIYANSPTAEINDAFRIHPKVVELKPVSIVPDLNMIEANRIYEVNFSIRYRTKLFDL